MYIEQVELSIEMWYSFMNYYVDNGWMVDV